MEVSSETTWTDLVVSAMTQSRRRCSGGFRYHDVLRHVGGGVERGRFAKHLARCAVCSQRLKRARAALRRARASNAAGLKPVSIEPWE